MKITTNLNEKLELIRKDIKEIDVKLFNLHSNESLNLIRIKDLTKKQDILKEKRDLLIIKLINN
ncbi:hypothetical protein UFOVP286_33 [uncultured Caudovirales phage]|uniref:Uncharacterized protein n=1 Tax=uncultured Caudovirales phage TaxID=2100421 RepID=A0A6J5LND0_9CAUD|nr:hypothetical protein UFOVP286_33 [uncultured Caudovirales phage]